MASITLEDIGKIYPDGTRAVGSVDLVVRDGEFLVLVGPSGCGKSTVLRMIAGLEDITEGKISIGDRVVNDVPPKDRDIAMVFQNYALYPHMTVFDNMAFGLKLRKMPKDEIRRRVNEAAETLEITEFLDRKPKALSGGQRQRVAMGRAIVREPKAFLMDEPLSNLDAKLRVQMRTELGRLHHRLNTTTVYVTHDQIEAMTLGHRVAVLRPVSVKRPYNLQQVAPPTELFNNPANLFVAGFIGSPAMNMVYGTLERQGEETWLSFASQRVKVSQKALDRHPGIDEYYGKQMVVGIRPGALEDVRVAGADADATIHVTTDVNELLGSESYVHFNLEAPPVVTPDIEELLADSGRTSASLGEKTRFTARVSPDVSVPDGSEADLAINTKKLHFFDLETGDKIGYAPTAEAPLDPSLTDDEVQSD
jgi:multiple sugar transport system ATP-binding protein